IRKIPRVFLLLSFLVLSLGTAAAADGDAVAIDTGHTAWIIAATALVLFMTIPGLSLFYAGLVRGRNVLSVLMHCFSITCVMTILWLAFGYSMAFDSGNNFIGGFGKAFLGGVGLDATVETFTSGGQHIPELIFYAFQMTFFIITPALMVGAFVERMKFSAMLLFASLWAILVYIPICHMVWGGGAMPGIESGGIVDHAGGIVVHITAGIGALVACILVGKRNGWPEAQITPHNLPMTVTGTAMLWVGWFGFNAGSGLAADGNAALTLIVTHTSAATAAFVWMLIEWVKFGKPSMLGAATGSIAGLAAITPASGAVGPLGALIIGTVSAILCWFFCAVIKMKFKYDDSLDVVGVHGVGGLVGTLLVAVLGAQAMPFGGIGEFEVGPQLGIQALASGITVVWTLVASFVILKIVGMITGGLRVSESVENEGLDLASHGETGYSD
ncbi:MAG: ammonium transporter, partial [Verrucomicrobiota bacterium]